MAQLEYTPDLFPSSNRIVPHDEGAVRLAQIREQVAAETGEGPSGETQTPECPTNETQAERGNSGVAVSSPSAEPGGSTGAVEAQGCRVGAMIWMNHDWNYRDVCKRCGDVMPKLL